MDQNSRQQNKQQNTKISTFYLGSRERYITISSAFDSGNIKVVKQISDFHYRLECADDGSYTNKTVNSKSWFYFQVSGFPKNTKGKFYVSRLQALSSIYYSKYAKCYRPVYRVNGEQWKRVEYEVPLNLKENGDLECTLQYTFRSEEERVQFAFCYPYQYKHLMDYLTTLECLEGDEELYYHREVLVLSPQKRNIHLLTITSHDDGDKERERQESIDPFLFPQKARAKRFKKPVVLITARVHPGQTPASYTMEGVIDFLTNKNDLRAHLLRKMFVFMIVPMINVDGVYHGHFRMDIFGKNLNRFYINPNKEQQPAIYAIKSLANHLISENRLSFYFDFHGHNAKKGCFIYGNAFADFVEQVESQVFCKLFSINHSGFEYEYCNFSEKHMNAKDRFEDLTKEGCGRVVMHKAANIIHSYSLQCGIISPNHINEVCQPSNKDFKVSQKCFVPDRSQEPTVEGERLFDNSVIFTQDSYRNLGKNLLVSILDVFDKNPYSRVYNSRYKSLDVLRRVTAFQIFHSAERFRMFQRFIFGKVKNINVLIQEIMNSKIHYRQLYNCYFSEDSQLKDVDWPRNILGLTKASRMEISKLRKLKSISETKIASNDDLERKLEEQIQKNTFRTTHKIEEQEKEETIELHRANSFDEGNTKNKIITYIKIDSIEPMSETLIESMPESMAEPTIEQHEVEQEPLKDIEPSKNEDDNSDQSQIEEEQINQQILLMCEDEKEQKEILSKIMQNNFNQKDYQQIQQKYKNKNQFQEEKIDKLSNISFSHTENTVQKYAKIQIIRDNSSTKEHQYRLTRKLHAINTQDLYSKPKGKKLNIGSDEKPIVSNNSVEERSQIIEIKKLSAAEQFRRNIYDSIKQEIKESLRREYQRKKQKQKLQNKLIDSFRFKKHPRAKQGHNPNDPKQIRSKVRLPSLGSNMYIITTSTRLINKN